MTEKKRAKAIVVVGAQWGDEGKGKVVDYLAQSFDYTARYAGGHNAGHTVIFDNHRFVLQLIPSGILRPGKKAVIGAGTVVDPVALLGELENLKRSGIDVRGRLFLSDRAHLIFPYHREMDKAAETARGTAKIGTTSRGIGPAYEDKMARRGIRVIDLLAPERFGEKLERVIAEKDAISRAAYGHPLDTTGIRDQYLEIAAHIRGLVTDTCVLLNKALDNGESVLFEGAQGTMLDIDHGTYPYVTSSNATSGGVATGLGVAPTRIGGVVGVTKAYTTRVGSGPFPTEMPDLDAQAVRERGNEFGAVTGRPRRCGWLDLVVLNYAKMLSGIDTLVVTKMDVFDAQPEIKVCTAYTHKGKTITEIPADVETMSELEPVYTTLPGWMAPTPGIKNVKDLPEAARNYLKFISDRMDVEIGMVSTGPERDATIVPPGTKLAGWL
ncbi:MAG: adenylosuccinate synthase [Candidatus Acidiferrales bacterium]